MSTPKQQTVPSQQLPPGAPPPLNGRLVGRSDMFVNLIEGPAVRIGIGLNEDLRIFVLPCRLLAQHSLLMRWYLTPSPSLPDSTNKRKLSQVSCKEDPTENTTRTEETEAVIKVERGADQDETKEEVIKVPGVDIHLEDIDPVVFGIFLHYIYSGGYPRNADLVTPAGPHQQYLFPSASLNPALQVPNQNLGASLPTSNNPAKRQRVCPGTSSATNISGTSNTAHHGPQVITSAVNGQTTDQSTLPIPNKQPPPIPSTPIPPAPTMPELYDQQAAFMRSRKQNFPPSIQAYFEGHYLGACAFINYATTRIHGAIGSCFNLTPSLVCTIWYCTQWRPFCMLRRLVLDFLITYWAHTDARMRASVIHRDERQWEVVFDKHRDLRNDFFRGLQDGVKVRGPEAYHTTVDKMILWVRGPVLVGQQSGARPGAGPTPGVGEEMEGVAQGT